MRFLKKFKEENLNLPVNNEQMYQMMLRIEFKVYCAQKLKRE